MTPGEYHLGLIGYPLGHSRSPALHQAALAACGLRGEYRLFAIPPDEQGLLAIQRLLLDLREGRLMGLNVTIPHKQRVMPFVDRLTETAEAVGSVNTLFMDEQGQLVGENTDVPGFLWDVERLVGSPAVGEPRGMALVLGAGGSARAVVYALAVNGWQVHVLARRVEQACQLVEQLGPSVPRPEHLRPHLLDAETLRELADSSGLLVNTTPLGMHPQVDGCPWPADLPLPARPNIAVYDLIYNPAETKLLRQAREAGLPGRSGAGMLVAQAALAFQCWTGLEPPLEVMERAFPAS